MKLLRVSFHITEQRLAELMPILVAEIGRFDVSRQLPPKIDTTVGQPYVSPNGWNHRTRCDGKAAQSGPGQVMLAVFNKMVLARGADFFDALEKDGRYSAAAWHNTVSKILAQGDLVRHARGVFRLPLDAERASKAGVGG